MATLNVESAEQRVYCVLCDYSLTIPYHCGKQMVINGDYFLCWKGEHQPCCNSLSKMDIPTHHDKKMVGKSI
jgi:hypothetical protein